MIKHIHQAFLLHCDYKSVNLAELFVPWKEVGWRPSWTEPRELLDGNEPLVRKISFSRLARGPSTQKEWDYFTAELQGIATIVIVDDRPAIKSPIVSRYADCSLQAFILRLQNAGINCRVTRTA